MALLRLGGLVLFGLLVLRLILVLFGHLILLQEPTPKRDWLSDHGAAQGQRRRFGIQQCRYPGIGS